MPSQSRMRWGRIRAEYTDPKTGKTGTRLTFCTPEFIAAAEKMVRSGAVRTKQELALALGMTFKGMNHYLIAVDEGRGTPPEIEFARRIRAAEVPRPSDAQIAQVEQLTSALCLTPQSLAPQLGATSGEIQKWLVEGGARDDEYAANADDVPRMVRFYRAYHKGRQNPLINARLTIVQQASGAVHEEIAYDKNGNPVLDARGEPVKLRKQMPGDIRAADLLLRRYGDEGERPASKHEVDVNVSSGPGGFLIDLTWMPRHALITLAGYEPAELGLNADELDLDDEGQDDPLDDEES